MPASEADLAASPAPQTLTELPFPPITAAHILNCSYHSWYSRYRALTPKCRLIALSSAFVSYLRADGIVLPDEGTHADQSADADDPGLWTQNDDEEDDEFVDPSADWPDIHNAIASTFDELGGKVAPKLNWSAPKDATWINPTNSMDCRTPNDIYLLLKSSDFVTHDLEHAFDGCVDGDQESIPYYLVLRKHVMMNPSVEFRCFVRRRILLGICQRDQNHFDFLFNMQDTLRDTIQDFFDQKLRDTFPDPNFVFDVYIPAPHRRVWLIDVNPWAQRTDPLLFSWLELLTMPEPAVASVSATTEQSFARLSLGGENGADADILGTDDSATEGPVDEEYSGAELRLIRKDDPEAYSFNTPQFSAHKLPRDVVDAAQGGAGSMRDFADHWKDVVESAQKEDANGESEDD